MNITKNCLQCWKKIKNDYPILICYNCLKNMKIIELIETAHYRTYSNSKNKKE